ncbi:MAG TPA: DUF2147 domain-containing protein [Caulobacteraceae bacterium]|jgi:uncharacterized protein (DUF2147 family)
MIAVNRAAAAVVAVAAFAAAIAAPAVAAPRPDGLWRITSDRDGKPLAMIRVQTVAGGQLSGVLTASLRGDNPNRVCDKCSGAKHNQRIVGMQVMWGLKPDPSNPMKYAGGSILDPDSGSVYGAEVTESADGQTLNVHGFLGISLIGRTQTWRRAGS